MNTPSFMLSVVILEDDTANETYCDSCNSCIEAILCCLGLLVLHYEVEDDTYDGEDE